MRNFLYVIAGLLIVIWGTIFFGFHSSQLNSWGFIHVLPILAGFIILLRISYTRKIARKSPYFTNSK